MLSRLVRKIDFVCVAPPINFPYWINRIYGGSGTQTRPAQEAGQRPASYTHQTTLKPSNGRMITIRIKETLFQKITGLRSMSGGRVLLRNALFG